LKVFSLIIIFVLLLSIGCSRKHLAIFFDGVPPEKTEEKLSADSLVVMESDSLRKDELAVLHKNKEKQILSLHPAYQNKECAKCHLEQYGYRLKETEPLLCNKCHTDYSKATPFVHGPVAAGFCSACHLPHKSANEHLLIKPKDEICGYCHRTEDVIKNSAHKQMAEKTCLECHYAHGGQTILMLKNNEAKNEE